MTADMDEKAALELYLGRARRGLLSKLEGLSEWDAHRPMTPTASSMLGIVKHVSWVQAGYLGEVFGRPFGQQPPWTEPGGADDDDMWARAEETLEDIVELFHRSCAHADETIAALDLAAEGRVPWWGDSGSVTLHRILLHLIAELERHAGHADILREQIDGVAGLDGPGDNLPERDAAAWSAYHAKVEAAAREAAGDTGEPTASSEPSSSSTPPS